jgi:hypothetical protein
MAAAYRSRRRTQHACGKNGDYEIPQRTFRAAAESGPPRAVRTKTPRGGAGRCVWSGLGRVLLTA